MESPERKRIHEHCRDLDIDEERVHGMADELGAVHVAQALFEAKDLGTSVRDVFAWCRWRAGKLAGDGLRASSDAASRRKAIARAAKARKDENDRAVRAQTDDKTFYECMPELVRGEFLAIVTAKLDPVLSKRLLGKTLEQSPILRALVVAEARRVGYTP